MLSLGINDVHYACKSPGTTDDFASSQNHDGVYRDCINNSEILDRRYTRWIIRRRTWICSFWGLHGGHETVISFDTRSCVNPSFLRALTACRFTCRVYAFGTFISSSGTRSLYGTHRNTPTQYFHETAKFK